MAFYESLADLKGSNRKMFVSSRHPAMMDMSIHTHLMIPYLTARIFPNLLCPYMSGIYGLEGHMVERVS